MFWFALGALSEPILPNTRWCFLHFAFEPEGIRSSFSVHRPSFVLASGEWRVASGEWRVASGRRTNEWCVRTDEWALGALACYYYEYECWFDCADGDG